MSSKKVKSMELSKVAQPLPLQYTVSIKEHGKVDLNVKRAKTPLQLGMRQKLIIPSCLPWKVVTFFGKEHV